MSKPCNGGSIGPAPVPQKILAELKVGEIPWIPWIFFLEKKTAQHENLEFRGGGDHGRPFFFGWIFCFVIRNYCFVANIKLETDAKFAQQKKRRTACLHLSEFSRIIFSGFTWRKSQIWSSVAKDFLNPKKVASLASEALFGISLSVVLLMTIYCECALKKHGESTKEQKYNYPSIASFQSICA